VRREISSELSLSRNSANKQQTENINDNARAKHYNSLASMKLLVAFILLLRIISLVFAEENKNEIISFPILHHEHVWRRHLEQRQNEESQNDAVEETHSGNLYQGIGTHYIVSVYCTNEL
jgi:hypothetical protein